MCGLSDYIYVCIKQILGWVERESFFTQFRDGFLMSVQAKAVSLWEEQQSSAKTAVESLALRGLASGRVRCIARC